MSVGLMVRAIAVVLAIVLFPAPPETTASVRTSSTIARRIDSPNLQIRERALPPERLAPPTDLVAGPDGNIWISESNNERVGRLSLDGKLAEVPIGATSQGITVGGDGNLWVTEPEVGKIGRVTPAGTVTTFVLPVGSYPQDIARGPDGNVWFTDRKGAIGTITPEGAVTEYDLPFSGVDLPGITEGPDGDLWFTAAGLHVNGIGTITVSGNLTWFALDDHRTPDDIVAGPDGNMWFTELAAFGAQRPPAVARITMDGDVVERTVSTGTPPRGIAVGADDAIYFTMPRQIGRITLDGHLGMSKDLGTHFSDYTRIILGPDGNLWFIETNSPPGAIAVLLP